MTPTESAIARLPAHLRRFVVAQDYAAYTPRDQAVWRHILRRLTQHLSDKAHDSYLRGLEATGIGVERIPSLDDMNEKLEKLGWSAVAVRGFIPPAVFTELQALGVLAIAADIRTFEHVEYTPAPDIVHESAGHAPIVADGRYAEYLKRCGMVGFKAIASLEDQAVFEAIRHLSVVKEDPTATEEDRHHAEARLRAASASRRYVSENTRASRLYWWTAEYGLVGELASPKIYGAGLLSSIGEAHHCLTESVKKVPHSLGCADTEFDITTMQPQLFVARDFDHLFEVLEEFEAGMAWKRGGDFGLQEALRAGTVNHLTLSSGLEITGAVSRVIPGIHRTGTGMETALTLLQGTILQSRNAQVIGKPSSVPALIIFGANVLPEHGPFDVIFDSGLHLTGFSLGGFETVNLRAHLGGRDLELPRTAFVFTSEMLPSVAGGPADPATWDRYFGEQNASSEGDAEAHARAQKAGALSPSFAAMYEEVRAMREQGKLDVTRLHSMAEAAKVDWLLLEEIHELLQPVSGAPSKIEGVPAPGTPGLVLI